MSEAYALIDRFLRNNLDDADYATFSDALEAVLASLPSERPEAEDARNWIGTAICELDAFDLPDDNNHIAAATSALRKALAALAASQGAKE